MYYDLSEEEGLLATNTWTLPPLYNRIGTWDERYTITWIWCKLFEPAQGGRWRGGGGGGGDDGRVSSTATTHVHVWKIAVKTSVAHLGAGARLVVLPGRTGRAVVLVADGERVDPLVTWMMALGCHARHCLHSSQINLLGSKPGAT